MEDWVDFDVSYIARWFIYPQTVSYPSSDH